MLQSLLRFALSCLAIFCSSAAAWSNVSADWNSVPAASMNVASVGTNANATGVSPATSAATTNHEFSLLPQTEHAPMPAHLEAPNTDEIQLTVRGNQLRVQRAEGLSLTVYNITGTKVATYRVESNDFTLSLNVDRGIYIVKVGKVARRITIA